MLSISLYTLTSDDVLDPYSKYGSVEFFLKPETLNLMSWINSSLGIWFVPSKNSPIRSGSLSYYLPSCLNLQLHCLLLKIHLCFNTDMTAFQQQKHQFSPKVCKSDCAYLAILLNQSKQINMRCCYPSPSSEPSQQQECRQQLKDLAGAATEHLVICVETGFQVVLSGGTVKGTHRDYFYMHK